MEATSASEPGGAYPRCIDGERAGAPEDVGGPHGYSEFLEALANRRHPRHKDMKEWIGGKWDAEAFDLASVDAELRSFALPRQRHVH